MRVLGTARATQWGYSLWEFQVFGTPASTASLLSQGRPVVASSTQAGFPATNAVDGNTTTRWSSAFTNNEWIYVDLGSTATVSRVLLNWEAAYGSGYQIQVSDNAANWTTIFTTTTGNGATDDLAVSGSGRYVRMLGTARATQWGYSLFEFQVYRYRRQQQLRRTARCAHRPERLRRDQHQRHHQLDRAESRRQLHHY